MQPYDDRTQEPMDISPAKPQQADRQRRVPVRDARDVASSAPNAMTDDGDSIVDEGGGGVGGVCTAAEEDVYIVIDRAASMQAATHGLLALLEKSGRGGDSVVVKCCIDVHAKPSDSGSPISNDDDDDGDIVEYDAESRFGEDFRGALVMAARVIDAVRAPGRRMALIICWHEEFMDHEHIVALKRMLSGGDDVCLVAAHDQPWASFGAAVSSTVSLPFPAAIAQLASLTNAIAVAKKDASLSCLKERYGDAAQESAVCAVAVELMRRGGDWSWPNPWRQRQLMREEEQRQQQQDEDCEPASRRARPGDQ